MQAAVRSLLCLGTSIASADESHAKEVAAAVANSFAEHVPNFKYDEQVWQADAAVLRHTQLQPSRHKERSPGGLCRMQRTDQTQDSRLRQR